MKKLFKGAFYTFDLLLVGVGAFYFWAKSPNLKEAEYSKVMTYTDAEASKNDSVFTLLTYNIGYLSGMLNNQSVKMEKVLFEDNMRRAKEKLSAVNADIIAFQEIDFNSNRSYKVNQHDELAKHLKMQYGAIAVNWDKKYLPFPYFPVSAHYGRIVSGQSFLSKFPIKEHERIVLEKVESQPFYYKAMYLDRLAEVAKIDINGTEVILINIHTEAFDQTTRINHIEYAQQLFKQYAKSYPVILLGDFNSDPDYENAGIKILLDDPEMGVACPESELNEGQAVTYYPDNEHLDFIFYTKDRIESLEWKVLSDFGDISDHYPVMMKFRFK
ncbi:endonuclease/exonuclease/phosphatase family protein [Limibacter armeniacum]|uniref:endonuclease/exonuclease/phosphatase family protein n=1 Tax=Limibacter armeniacum TaxID=466084 RepID=UPI002FE6BAF7